MNRETIFTNAKVVTPQGTVLGAVVVRGSHIEAIEAKPLHLQHVCGCGQSLVHDMQGDYLIPGLIEVHTDN